MTSDDQLTAPTDASSFVEEFRNMVWAGCSGTGELSRTGDAMFVQPSIGLWITRAKLLEDLRAHESLTQALLAAARDECKSDADLTQRYQDIISARQTEEINLRYQVNFYDAEYYRFVATEMEAGLVPFAPELGAYGQVVDASLYPSSFPPHHEESMTNGQTPIRTETDSTADVQRIDPHAYPNHFAETTVPDEQGGVGWRNDGVEFAGIWTGGQAMPEDMPFDRLGPHAHPLLAGTASLLIL